MRLRFRLLLKSINSGQLVTFSIASLIGAVIVILGIWSYSQVSKVMESRNSVFKGQYLVVTKPVSSANTITSLILKNANPSAFSKKEITQLEELDGVSDIAPFRSSDFDTYGYAGFMGVDLSTKMFLESVPDRFLDISPNDWKADVDDREIPVIVPRTYLDFYNYGFASSNGTPQISEELLSAVTVRLVLNGGGRTRNYSCRVAGFSDRLNSILVPESFLMQASETFGGKGTEPVRLIIETTPNGFTKVSQFITDNGYVIEGGGDTARLATVLKRVLTVVIIVGAIFSALAFILLLITVMLMIERNRTKNAILSSLGYTHKAIAAPYQTLAIGMDILSCLLATVCAFLLKPLVSDVLAQLSPAYIPGENGTILISAVVLLILSAGLHTITIYGKSR